MFRVMIKTLSPMNQPPWHIWRWVTHSVETTWESATKKCVNLAPETTMILTKDYCDPITGYKVLD